MSAGKGDKPRNCFSRQYKDNYDSIDWGKKLICPQCSKPVNKDHNSFWCHDCERLWPKDCGFEKYAH